jgi:hypothetical protein
MFHAVDPQGRGMRRTAIGPRTACLLGVGGVSLLNGFVAPVARAQDGRSLERFERQLEQIQRENRVLADDAVPVDQRMLIDYGGYVTGSFAAIDDPAQETHVFRQYDLVGYGRVNVDGAHELFARVRTTYRDFNAGDAFGQHGDDWVEPTLDRAHYRFDLTRHLESTEGVTPKGNVVVQVGRQLINWGNGLTLSEEVDGASVVLSYEPVSLELLAGSTRTSVSDFDSSRPGFLGDTQRAFYGALLSAQLGTHRPYAYGLIQRDHNDQDTLVSGDVTTEFAYDSFYVGIGSAGGLTDRLSYGVELVYEGGDALSNSFELPFAQVEQSEEDVHAFAADLRLDYAVPDANRSRLSAELIFATGDSDRLSTSSTFGGNEPGTDDHAFNAFGLINTGLAFSPDVSNVLIGRLGASTFPLPREDLFSKLQVGVDGFVFSKANPDAPIDEATGDSRYLGAEADLFLNWQLSSDVAFTLRYGVFFPGQGIETDHDERHFLFTGLTYAF